MKVAHKLWAITQKTQISHNTPIWYLHSILVGIFVIHIILCRGRRKSLDGALKKKTQHILKTSRISTLIRTKNMQGFVSIAYGTPKDKPLYQLRNDRCEAYFILDTHLRPRPHCVIISVMPSNWASQLDTVSQVQVTKTRICNLYHIWEFIKKYIHENHFRSDNCKD